MENIEHKRIDVKGEEKDRKYKKDIRKQRNGCGFKARAKKKKKKEEEKRIVGMPRVQLSRGKFVLL